MPRKTRKQKEKALKKRGELHPAPYGPEGTHTRGVKREFEFSFTGLETSISKTKKADKSFYLHDSGTTARDLIKTVLLAVVIFSLEIMIYFAWFKKAGLGYQFYNLINGQLKQLF